MSNELTIEDIKKAFDPCLKQDVQPQVFYKDGWHYWVDADGTVYKEPMQEEDNGNEL